MSKLSVGMSPGGFLLVAKRGTAWFQPERPDLDSARLEAIVAPLFRHGGTGVVLDPSAPFDTWAMRLTRAAKVGLRLVRGAPNSCHENAAALAKKRGWRLMTGYARARRDPLWRAHSWCVDGAGRIVETTTPRALYVGR